MFQKKFQAPTPKHKLGLSLSLMASLICILVRIFLYGEYITNRRKVKKTIDGRLTMPLRGFFIMTTLSKRDQVIFYFSIFL